MPLKIETNTNMWLFTMFKINDIRYDFIRHLGMSVNEHMS